MSGWLQMWGWSRGVLRGEVLCSICGRVAREGVGVIDFDSTLWAVIISQSVPFLKTFRVDNAGRYTGVMLMLVKNHGAGEFFPFRGGAVVMVACRTFFAVEL